jgi:hypothetical protein
MVDGKQIRKYDAAWTEDDARAALVARQEAIKNPPAASAPAPTEHTLGELVEKYLAYKKDTGKRSLKEDRRICQRQSKFPQAW